MEKKWKSLFLFMVVIIGTAFNVNATDYYVSKSEGDNNNDGLTSSTPWKSMWKVGDKSMSSEPFLPGDRILFKKVDTWTNMLYGSYQGAQDNPIIFGAYGDDNDPLPKIAPTSDSAISIGASYVNFQDIELDGSSGASTGIYIDDEVGEELVSFKDLKIHDFSGDGISIAKRGNVIFRNVEVYSNGGGGIAVQKSGSPSSWSELLSFSTILIENSNIHNNARNGIYIAGHGAVVQNNVITQNGSESHLYHNFYLIGDNALIENNDITYSPAGLGLRYYGSDIILRNNFIWGNFKSGVGFWSDILDGVYSGIEIYNNIISAGINSTSGAIGTTTNNGTFEGMTIYNNTIYVMEGHKGISASDCTNVIVKNNIIYGEGEFTAISVKEACQDGFVSENNLIYSSDPTPFIWGTNNQSISDWKSFGFDLNSVFADPQFVNTSGNPNQPSDFQLQATSPAIDVGATISLVKDDYLGIARPQGSGYDIGAFEWGAKINASPADLSIDIQYLDGSTVKFTASANYIVWSYKWDFGDGIVNDSDETSIEYSIEHTFPKNGTYKVSLTVIMFDPSVGYPQEITITKTVIVPEPRQVNIMPAVYMLLLNKDK